MVHCVSSSEPDTEGQLTIDLNPVVVKEMPASQIVVDQQTVQQAQQATITGQTQMQPQNHSVPTTKVGNYDETTATMNNVTASGIQVGSQIEQSTASDQQLTLTIDPNHHYHLQSSVDTTNLDNISNEQTIIPNNDSTIIDSIPLSPSSQSQALNNHTIVHNAAYEALVRKTLGGDAALDVGQVMLVSNDDNFNDDDQSVVDDANAAAASAVGNIDEQKLYGVGVAASLYPHLYNFESTSSPQDGDDDQQQQQQQQQQIAVVSYQTTTTTTEKLQQAFFNPYVYGNAAALGYAEAVAAATELEEEDSPESSEEDDEEL